MRTSSERRDNTRLPLNCVVWHREGEGGYRRGELIDLSSTGASLKCNTPLGENVELVLRLQPGCYVRARGKAVWQTSERAGLHFEAPPNPMGQFLGKGTVCLAS